MNDDRSISEDSDSETCVSPQLQGVLSKWTNYIHGWQDRFIVLKDGTLSYYKNEEESGFGCRGAISLYKATIKSHELDDCRFDVSVSDCSWYLRAASTEEKQHWVDVLESYKKESGYGTGSENSLKRHGSVISLQSNTFSTTSNSAITLNLNEKIAELETFKDILCKQIDNLQHYFEHCAVNNGQLTKLDTNDFKGEAITFKTTAGGVITTLEHCLELINQREEHHRKRLDKEIDRRKRFENLAKNLQNKLDTLENLHPGPDLEEGPHSVLPDDVFYDAVETSLDKLDIEMQTRERIRSVPQANQKNTNQSQEKKKIEPIVNDPSRTHRLWPDVRQVCHEQLSHALKGISSEDGGWHLFAQEGEMKMYRREEIVNGMVMDPLKACHVVNGITGKELCHYFFRPEYRMDWETTLEDYKILETISDDLIVFLQIHKRVWPAAQRDALFWSHLGSAPNPSDNDGPQMWYVCNRSTEFPENPQSAVTKCVRLFITVFMLGQTLIRPPKDGAKISRNDISCKITYCSTINPGGWAPASVLRAVYKKEYPKFLKRFTAYVVDKRKDQPIMF